jgi:hypothetical protein
VVGRGESVGPGVVVLPGCVMSWVAVEVETGTITVVDSCVSVLDTTLVSGVEDGEEEGEVKLSPSEEVLDGASLLEGSVVDD